MQITDFIHEHIEQATLLAKASYAEEWARVTVLPRDITIPDLLLEVILPRSIPIEKPLPSSA